MSSIKKNFLYNSLYQILVIFIPLVTIPYLTRTISADGVGTYSYYYSISAYFVMFIMLGLNNYGNREIAKVKDNEVLLRETFWNIYTIQFVCGILLNCLYLVFCLFFSKNRLISLIMMIYVVSGIFDINWFFFGMGKFKLTVIRNTIIKVLDTIMIFVFVRNSGDVWIYCLIMTLGMLLSQIVLWPCLVKEVNYVKPTFKNVKIHIKPNLFLFLTVIAVSLFKIMDKIMLGAITTHEEVGVYEASEKVISVPMALITSLGTVMLPHMSNLINKDKSSANIIIEKSIVFALFLASSLCFGIMGIAKQFVPLFYGEGFDICIILFQILLPSCIFLAFANVIRTQYLLPHKIDKPYVISAFLGAVINLAVNFLLIPYFGAVGAAVGTFAAELSVCIYQTWSVSHFLPVKKYVVSVLPYLFSGLIMYVVLMQLDMPISAIKLLLVKVVIGIVIYTVSLIILNQLFFKRNSKLFKK